MRFVYFTLSFLILLNSCSSEKKEQFDILIKNGNIIDLETGTILQQDILITNGRIKKIYSCHMKQKQKL